MLVILKYIHTEKVQFIARTQIREPIQSCLYFSYAMLLSVYKSKTSLPFSTTFRQPQTEFILNRHDC